MLQEEHEMNQVHITKSSIQGMLVAPLLKAKEYSFLLPFLELPFVQCASSALVAGVSRSSRDNPLVCTSSLVRPLPY